MTGDASELRRALTPFRERPMSVHQAEERRERIVTALRRQVRELPRQRHYRTRLRWFAGLAAAAGVMGAALLAWRLGPSARAETGASRAHASVALRQAAGGVFLQDGNGTRPFEPGAALPLPFDGRLRVEPGARAELETERGLKLSLGESSVVSLSDLGRAAQDRLKLESGEVTCRVPRLGVGESFAVVTPTARVVVHGTVFRVRVNEGAHDGSTCVEVSEGAVIVHHGSGQVALNAGDSWGCEDDKQARAAEGDEERSALAPERAAPARDGSERRPAGTLEPEVRLLQSALVQERSGDAAAAERSLRQLLRKYPHSPLATEARAALARIRAKR